jgi:hypothetical protein
MKKKQCETSSRIFLLNLVVSENDSLFLDKVTFFKTKLFFTKRHYIKNLPNIFFITYLIFMGFMFLKYIPHCYRIIQTQHNYNELVTHIKIFHFSQMFAGLENFPRVNFLIKFS